MMPTLLGRLVGAAPLCLLFLGCDQIDNIDVDFAADASVPKKTLVDALLGELPLDGFDSMDFEQRFANQGVSPDQVDSVRLKTFTLTVTSPDEATFDFLDGVSFYASAPGQEEVRVASAAAIPAGARTIELTLDDVELADYATASSMTMRAEVEGSKPDVDTQIHAAVVFDVDVAIPGCN
jgi:hypothetical protein